jgi:hypothetical protein
MSYLMVKAVTQTCKEKCDEGYSSNGNADLKC